MIKYLVSISVSQNNIQLGLIIEKNEKKNNHENI